MSRIVFSKRAKILASLMLVAVVLVAVNAAVYINRSIDINISVRDSSEASGVAAGGFYVGGNTQLQTLTSTNNSRTYDTNRVMVFFDTPVKVVDDGTTAITLYAKATVVTNVTVGQWVFEKLLGFGVPGSTGHNAKLVVEQASNAASATVDVYRITGTGSNKHTYYIGTYDITQNNAEYDLGGVYPDSSGAGYYITMHIYYTQPTTDNIKLGIYFSQI